MGNCFSSSQPRIQERLYIRRCSFMVNHNPVTVTTSILKGNGHNDFIYLSHVDLYDYSLRYDLNRLNQWKLSINPCLKQRKKVLGEYKLYIWVAYPNYYLRYTFSAPQLSGYLQPNHVYALTPSEEGPVQFPRDSIEVIGNKI